MEDRTAGVDAECSRSIQGDCVPSQFSKPYLMYSTTDAAFAIVDFAKGNVEDGVMNSPPSRGAGRSPVYSLSPLQGCNWTPIGQCSCSLIEQTIRTPQRQLYSKPPVCSTEEAQRQIQCIMTKRFGYNQQQNYLSCYRMGPADINSQRSEVTCFGHSRSLGSLPCSCRRGIVYHRARMPTPSVVNPTLNRHCLHLFGNVENGNVHLLEFLVRKPIRAGTRF
jgi:hypothetical protein